ncbi:Putative R3H domain, SUZ domain, R3H domain superfamily protein [Colletotrichum destructivum]|uniref:R3H domain, SUZ domain, R3H domain superfamily protein n=1 Tax=Colletotrichum destructivum TaxID=34406 RepID=A0AAX4J0P4_9PEZI|nr:Putative R3H domain, SUZ domain, R3H domain superfamily protein [Colletotrichum destructivum]
MATAHMSSDVPKPSFAKVAASASKDNLPVTTVRRVTASAQNRPEQASSAGTAPVPTLVANGADSRPPPAMDSTKPAPTAAKREPALPKKTDATDLVVDGLKDLNIGQRTPSLVVNGTGSSFTERSKSVAKDGSDDSQKADSSSELGTKPPSLDGKSITSGTTFALDEKESLRPDDSASVKAAAAEDDDSFSFRGPNLPSSRMGSDIAARARGIIQLGDMPDRRLAQPISGSLSQGMITPQSASSDQPPMPPANALSATLPDSANLLNTIYGQAPDEKLLEAMASPKDRLFLLRLEAELIKFVQNSKEPYMDFPPSNSFCRMLTHKLADYYRMTHQYEARVGSVRIFRTPYARVPESLASIAAPETNAETPPPPAVLPRKIMRRGEEGEFGPNSASPSKATSETGSDSKDKSAAANQKLSREQREEAYKQARERIFGNSEKTGESTPDNEGENGVSRASSVSARDKTQNGKRGKMGKQRRDDSDSFDSRHNYTPYWGPQQQTWMPQPQYVPVSNQYGAPVQQQPQQQQPQQSYPNQIQAPYNTTPTQTFAPMMPNAGYNASYPNMPPYPSQQPNQARFQPPANPSNYGGAGPVPPQQQQGWQQGFGPAPVPMTPPSAANATAYTPRGMSAPPGQGTVPYMYGQLPANINPNDPKSQHPIPGSYNRHAFNPKTQSFVPGGGMAPMQPPQPPFSAPGSHHGSPQIGSPHLAYAGYQQPGPPAPYGYGMARQGSNNSIPSYHPPPPQHPHHLNPLPQAPGSHTPQHPPQHLPQNPSPHIPNKPVIPQGPAGHTFSHLPHYGNPATLPQKPNMGV